MDNSENLRPAPHCGRGKGKLATRLDEVKNPWRQTSTLEFSHNEAARLATDALLESGERDYRKVLNEEKELSFLSPLEIRYIIENVNKNSSPESSCNGNDRDFDGDTVSELTSGTYFPMMSDEEPPILELGWPDPPHRFGPSETQIYFQRDKSQNIKDLIRSLISKAKKVIALVMDIFTDVDLFCDLMEASNKRKVPVYILLDEKNLDYFLDMCNTMEIDNTHLANMRIRSVCGDTYCTKSGKKFTGQVQEKFMIIDCEEVLAGSYSFTWLSAQVHSNMLLHFSGRITDSFDREFRCLYADSQVVDNFYNPDDDDLPYYSTPAVTMANIGLDFLQDRIGRERVPSEHSSSQSSSSMSSIKAAPGRPATVYKVTQEKQEVNSGAKASDRRGGGGHSPAPSSPGSALIRSSPNGSNQNHLTERQSHIMPERPSHLQERSNFGPTTGMEWARAGTPEFLRANLGGPISKFQALGLYDHKNYFSPKGPPAALPAENYGTRVPQAGLPVENYGTRVPQAGLPVENYGTRVPQAGLPVENYGTRVPHAALPMENKYNPKPTGSSNILNKLTDFFTAPNKDKDPYAYKRSPTQSTAYGGPDLSQAEPESRQVLPAPGSVPKDSFGNDLWLNRRDEKRMTLGHSKLDLVNQYNKRTKPVYSRFELKSNN
ncbi:hypothetical protein ACEWY4_012929 [Coilia grayii]|uniref:Scaffolding anchor of CK1 domain-containing protein n=1 Tax=Coilia grayii TaxID=363190 RepID=A0ABD1JUU6_9TELE